MRKLEKERLIADAKGKWGCAMIGIGFLVVVLMAFATMLIMESDPDFLKDPINIVCLLLGFAPIWGGLYYLLRKIPANNIKKDRFVIEKRKVLNKFDKVDPESDRRDYFLMLLPDVKTAVPVSQREYERVQIGHPYYVVFLKESPWKPYLIYDATIYELGDSLELKERKS